jgi:hypothetical protein
MMISPVAGATQADMNGAFAVLAVMANPEAAKARLEELVSESERASQAYTQAQAAHAEATAKTQEASTLLAEAQAVAAANEKEAQRLVALNTRLTAGESSLAQRTRAAAEDRATFDAIVSDKKQELAEREAAVRAREEAAEATMTEGNALKTEYEAKLAKLRATVA